MPKIKIYSSNIIFSCYNGAAAYQPYIVSLFSLKNILAIKWI